MSQTKYTNVMTAAQYKYFKPLYWDYVLLCYENQSTPPSLQGWWIGIQALFNRKK